MLVPWRGNELNNFIAGWYIDNDLCNEIVDYFEKNPDLFVHDEYVFCGVTPIHALPKNLVESYSKQMFTVIELYKEKYKFSYEDLVPWHMTPPMFHKYLPGQSFSRPHCENDGSTDPEVEPRHLSLMTYFCDIKDEGGTYFYNQDITTPSEKGLTILFPAHWTHRHRGMPATNDTKYITTSFAKFVR